MSMDFSIHKAHKEMGHGAVEAILESVAECNGTGMFFYEFVTHGFYQSFIWYVVILQIIL